IQAEADKIGIQVSISSRAKHFYSIYQKMRKRNKEPSELFDLLALRVQAAGRERRARHRCRKGNFGQGFCGLDKRGGYGVGQAEWQA
ncbi:MAG: bifunctional (p)ppGpp synthetase/guanosine-3',5'-bis(diphosphate) 3'-pyrophosphohydrolase, partial [Tidjanibacter sp.]|nr:bifunctional (p)ppGpp synthetase/guanosine-3',5'-bis(diphosphate) 3'-pyrophosphohydrolase [Tidjanibacter sp.]